MRLAEELNKVLASHRLAYRATAVPATDPEIEDDSIEVGLPDERSLLKLRLSSRYATINRLHYKAGELEGAETLHTLRRADWLAIINATIAVLAGVSPAVAATASHGLVGTVASTRTEAEAREHLSAETRERISNGVAKHLGGDGAAAGTITCTTKGSEQ